MAAAWGGGNFSHHHGRKRAFEGNTARKQAIPSGHQATNGTNGHSGRQRCYCSQQGGWQRAITWAGSK